MTSDFAAGNYRFIPAVFQYSAGAAANPGFEIERVRFDRPVALAEGFAQIAKYTQAAGRPLTSGIRVSSSALTWIRFSGCFSSCDITARNSSFIAIARCSSARVSFSWTKSNSS